MEEEVAKVRRRRWRQRQRGDKDGGRRTTEAEAFEGGAAADDYCGEGHRHGHRLDGPPSAVHVVAVAGPHH
jgi:hypothetical protein